MHPLICAARILVAWVFLLVDMKASALALPQILLARLAVSSPTWGAASQCGELNHTVDDAGNKLGAVASQSDICSNIGGNVLKKGGNAADAAVATVLCVGVIGMHHR